MFTQLVLIRHTGSDLSLGAMMQTDSRNLGDWAIFAQMSSISEMPVVSRSATFCQKMHSHGV